MSVTGTSYAWYEAYFNLSAADATCKIDVLAKASVGTISTRYLSIYEYVP